MNKKQGQLSISVTQIVAILAVAVSLFLVIDFGRRAAANYRMNGEVLQLEKEIAAERERQQRLLAEIAYVQSDAYIEKVAREELKWGRVGEIQVVIMATPQAPAVAPTPTSALEPRPAREHWEEWWDFFFVPDQ
jgi:cell division protein FtsB